jgi:hypothetical protein
MVKQYIKDLFAGFCRSYDGIGFWFGAISAILLLLLPSFDLGGKMNATLTIMSLSSRLLIVFGFIFISVILTSYSIYKKHREEIADLQRKLDAERENLKQRLEPVIKEIDNLMRVLSRDRATRHFLQDKAENYLIQKWLDEAKISFDNQNKYFSDCNCLPAEVDVVRNCYILLYAEDWIDNSKTLDYLFRNARTFFLGGMQRMCAATDTSADIKITPAIITIHNENLYGSTPFEFHFKYYSLDDALARNDEEILNPTDIVRRVEKSLRYVKDYLIAKELLKEETI